MKYWHELTDEEAKALYESHVTWGHIEETYKQPDWCTYPDALRGWMGCWSLTDPEIRKKISEDYCRNCGCFSKPNSEQAPEVCDATKDQSGNQQPEPTTPL